MGSCCTQNFILRRSIRCGLPRLDICVRQAGPFLNLTSLEPFTQGSAAGPNVFIVSQKAVFAIPTSRYIVRRVRNIAVANR